MKVTFRKNVKIKFTGQVISAGVSATGQFVTFDGRDYVEVTIPEGTEIAPGNVLSQPMVVKTRQMTFFFKPPTIKTLEKWSWDGVAKSVTGKRCEPDGHSFDGAPSWLLALGMI